MTYKEAMDYMKEVGKKGSVLGLEPMKELCKRLGHKENRIKIIHVAGTNGKGSTCAFIASVLAMAGYVVGKYNSPDVFCVHESISIVRKHMCDGEQGLIHTILPEESFACNITKIRKVCDQMERDGYAHPTSFEIETACAFLHFVKSKVDVVILEVGLGGREDATNAISNKLCSVITSISMDHMQFLGDTLEKIAYEKAGIIANHGLVISDLQKENAMNVIEGECENKSATLIVTKPEEVTDVEHHMNGISFCYKKELGRLDVPFLGVHQIRNAILAIDLVFALRSLGFEISDESIRQGLKCAVWHGRMELISKKPMIIIDGAHNEGAARVLAESIQIYFKNKKIIYVIGIFADKDYKTVLQTMLPYSNTIIAIKPDNKRALSSDELAQAVLEEKMNYHKICKNFCEVQPIVTVHTSEDITHIPTNTNNDLLEDVSSVCRIYDAKTPVLGMELAKYMAREEDVILAFGSLSFLKDVLAVTK